MSNATTSRTIISICSLCCSILLGIVTIVIGALNPGNCNMKSELVDADISTYLIVHGTISILILLLLYGAGIISLCATNSPLAAIIVVFEVIVIVLLAIFSIVWFIIGAIILFDANIECINEGSVSVIFALVLWCISAYHILVCCCSHKNKNDD